MFPLISCCIGEAPKAIEQMHNAPIISTPGKITLITDIALAALAIAAGICALLAAQGFNLGHLNVLGSIGPQYAWLMIGVGGGIILLDMTVLLYRLVRVIGHLKDGNQKLSRQGSQPAIPPVDLPPLPDPMPEPSDSSARVSDLEENIRRLTTQIETLKEEKSTLVQQKKDVDARLLQANQAMQQAIKESVSRQTSAVEEKNLEIQKLQTELTYLKDEIDRLKKEKSHLPPRQTAGAAKKTPFKKPKPTTSAPPKRPLPEIPGSPASASVAVPPAPNTTLSDSTLASMENLPPPIATDPASTLPSLGMEASSSIPQLTDTNPANLSSSTVEAMSQVPPPLDLNSENQSPPPPPQGIPIIHVPTNDPNLMKTPQPLKTIARTLKDLKFDHLNNLFPQSPANGGTSSSAPDTPPKTSTPEKMLQEQESIERLTVDPDLKAQLKKVTPSSKVPSLKHEERKNIRKLATLPQGRSKVNGAIRDFLSYLEQKNGELQVKIKDDAELRDKANDLSASIDLSIPPIEPIASEEGLSPMDHSFVDHVDVEETPESLVRLFERFSTYIKQGKDPAEQKERVLETMIKLSVEILAEMESIKNGKLQDQEKKKIGERIGSLQNQLKILSERLDQDKRIYDSSLSYVYYETTFDLRKFKADAQFGTVILDAIKRAARIEHKDMVNHAKELSKIAESIRFIEIGALETLKLKIGNLLIISEIKRILFDMEKTSSLTQQITFIPKITEQLNLIEGTAQQVTALEQLAEEKSQDVYTKTSDLLKSLIDQTKPENLQAIEKEISELEKERKEIASKIGSLKTSADLFTPALDGIKSVKIANFQMSDLFNE